MPLTITHFTADSLPRVVTGAAGTSTLDVLLPFRVDLDDPALTVTGWSLDVDVDGRSCRARVRTRRLRPGLAEALRERMARTRTLHAVDPRFTRDDVRRIHTPGAFHAGEAWVLHHRRAGGLDQFRIDVADLGRAPERAELVVQVGGTVVDLAAGRYPTLPLVDLAADSVSFAVPHDGDVLPTVTVRHRGGDTVPVDLAARG